MIRGAKFKGRSILLENHFELARYNDEATFRTVISRAYYAAFCSARDCAGLKNERDGVHRRVREWFSSHTFGRYKKVGRAYLKPLWRLRVKSDYEGDTEVSEKDAEQSLKLAERILDILTAHCPNMTKPKPS